MSTPSALVLYTVGHGNRRLEDFIALLRAAGVTTLVDVRAYPASSRHPHFAGDALRRSLEESGIVYHWAGRHLGGFRRPRAASAHTALKSEGLRAYADHMETEAFRKAIGQLISLARQTSCAIMCAEKDPASCHRVLIADYLILRDVRVVHLIEPACLAAHRLDPRARVEGEKLVYDAAERALDLH